MTATPPAPRRQFDLIVIGAGPAGAAAAKVAADSGLAVALVDKRRFPRHKLCGGGITGRALAHYKRIFGNSLPDVPLVRCDTISFQAFGQDLGLTQNVSPLHLAMRLALDQHLVDCALHSGAHDFTGQDGTVDPDAPVVHLPDRELAAPIIIACDGVNSPTARRLFGQPFDRNEIGFALEVESPLVDDSPVRIDFGAADWGYGWRFPKTSGTTIGVGGVLSRNADMKGALSKYLDRLGADPALPVKGQFLPFGAFRKTPGKGRVLLAGDAAGLVDPITGEGIGHALHSGELAALAAVRALDAKTPERALADYCRSLAPIHRGLGQARMLRMIMFHGRLRPTFIKSFQSSRSLRGEYFRMMAGDIEYSDLMRHVAKRMPGFAMRAMLRI
ncbi:geranylgeranyl reductase family protein [Tropicibacter sp. S64]|uniref:geranylgeranyl reductase family protein n=1 Tax=Tropicibacter sp. S64 TaxID=3415122 RepID=UPI003C7AEF76